MNCPRCNGAGSTRLADPCPHCDGTGAVCDDCGAPCEFSESGIDLCGECDDAGMAEDDQ